MKRRYDLQDVRYVIDSGEAQKMIENGWVLLSVRSAGTALPGIPHQDLIYELGWPRKVDGFCCRWHRPARRRPATRFLER